MWTAGDKKRQSNKHSSAAAAAEQQLAGDKQQLSSPARPRGYQVASDPPPTSWIYGSCLAPVSGGICNLHNTQAKQSIFDYLTELVFYCHNRSPQT